MATAKLSTKRNSLSIRIPSIAPAHLAGNVVSLGQARVNRETPTYLTGRI